MTDDTAWNTALRSKVVLIELPLGPDLFNRHFPEPERDYYVTEISGRIKKS